ncbi:JAB domain-containing protein, partial [Stutzerimonas stutzeri]
SQADRTLTRKLKDALELIDVRTLDHIIVAGQEQVSFAELGLL